MASSTTDTFLEILYDGSGLDPTEAVDFVAVHGLNPHLPSKSWTYASNPLATMEHARKTWTHDDTGMMWLKDFLPRQIPHARVLLFGYNANVAFNGGMNSVREHADNLLDRVRRRRVKKNKCEDRPIVFVGYSFGGLLVKQALVQARGVNKYASVLKATYGIVFFGTPHHGGGGASFGSVVSDVARSILQNPPNPLLGSFENATMFADTMNEDFTGQNAKYKIVNFYETLPEERTGCILVSKKSVVLGLPEERETALPIEADHSNICRFADANGEDYELIEESLSEMAEEAVKIFKTRQSPITSASSDVPSPKKPSTILPKSDSVTTESSTIPLSSDASAATEFSTIPLVLDVPALKNSPTVALDSTAPIPTKSLIVATEVPRSTESLVSPSTLAAPTLTKPLTMEQNSDVSNITKSSTVSSPSDTPAEFAVAASTGLFSLISHGSVMKFSATKPATKDTTTPAKSTTASSSSDYTLTESPLVPPKSSTVYLKSDTPKKPSLSPTKLTVFVKRDELMKQLEGKLPVPRTTLRKPRIVPIWGVGGTGKTELALQYISMHQSKYKQITWIDATDKDSLIHDFEGLYLRLVLAKRANPVRDLGLMEPADPKYHSKVIEFAKSWLEEPGSSRWLLVFDNASRKETLLTIKQLIPQSGRGDIIITSRLRESCNLGRQHIIEVNKMEDMEAVTLLLTSADYVRRSQGVLLAGDDDNSEKLIEELGCMPLAVKLAGAYISCNSGSLESYLALYNENSNKERSTGRGPTASRFDKILNTVLEISFQAIKKENPHAAELFLLMGYLHHETISVEFFKRASGSWQSKLKYKRLSSIDNEEEGALELLEEIMAKDKKGEWQKKLFTDAMETLMSYSFLRTQLEESFYLHPLVHQWSRDYSLAHGQQWRFRIGLFLAANAIKCKEGSSLLSMRELIRHQDRLRHASQEWKEVEMTYDIDFLSMFGYVYHSHGRWKDEENVEKRVVAAKKKVKGEEHPDTLTAMAYLATTYHSQNRWKEAEILGGEVLAIRKRVLGETHADTILSMGNLAAAYGCQGRWKEAEELGGQVLAGSQKALGESHPDTLKSMGNLASAHFSEGRLKESAELEQKVLAGRRKILGDKHPETLTAMNNLALSYSGLNRREEAEDLELEVVNIRKELLGEEHPDTLRSMVNLGTMYDSHGNSKKAEDLFEEVLAIRKRELGEIHPETLESMTSLGILYSSQPNRLKEAEDLFVQIVSAKQKLSSEIDSGTLISMANLEKIYASQKRWKEAEELGVKVLAERKRVLGETHPYTLESMASLGYAYYSQGRFKEAEKLGIQVVAMRRKVLGEMHPNTLESMAGLAEIYIFQNRHREAETLTAQVLAERKKTLGELHPDTLQSMADLIAAYNIQGRWKEAEKIGVQVVAGRKKVLGEAHPETMASMGNLGFIYYELDRPKEAEKLEVQVLAAMRKTYGGTNFNTITAMNNLAMTYISQGRWKEAVDLKAELLAARKKEFGEAHPDTLTEMVNLASLYSDHGLLEKSEEMEVEVLDMRKKVLGETHPDTLTSMNSLITTYIRQGQLKKARDLGVQTVAATKKAMGEKHPDTLRAMLMLTSIISIQGGWQEAAGGSGTHAEASMPMAGPSLPPPQDRKRKGKKKAGSAV